MKISIVWEKDRPYFISDDKRGDCLLLNFGLEYADDVEVSNERFFVFLQNDGSTWKAKIDDKLSYGTLHRDLIHELTARINSALAAKSSFDMVEYVTSNKKDHAYFSHHVCWIEKYRPAPPGISRLIS